MDGLGIKLPRVNQIIMLAVTLLILFAVIRMLPEGIKKWFKI